MSQSRLVCLAAGFWYGGKLVGAGEMSFTDMMQVKSCFPQRLVSCMQELAFFTPDSGVTCGPLRGCMPKWRQGTSLTLSHL